MHATNPTTILARTSQCLAAAALMLVCTFGANPTASAKPFQEEEIDLSGYEQCIKDHPGPFGAGMCCESAGGVVGPNGYCVILDSSGLTLERSPDAPAGTPFTPVPKVDAPQAPAAPGPVFTPIPRAPNRGQG